MSRPSPTRLCTFNVGERTFGLEVEAVQEVLRPMEITPVALAHSLISGLINLRGQIVMAVDLRRCLGLSSDPASQPAMNLVIRTPDGPVDLLVDRIEDVLELGSEEVEPAPPNFKGPYRHLIRGLIPHDGRIIWLLDADAVLALIEPRPDVPT